MSEQLRAYKILYADTGDNICIWLPPYLVCRKENEKEAISILEEQTKLYMEGKKSNDLQKVPKRST